MSLTFSQILSRIDFYCKSNSSSYSVADKTANINLALDRVWSIIFKAGGTWQYDDSAHSDYPIITTNLVAGQRDYSFVTDEQGNLVLDIYKVLVAQPDGTFKELNPKDVQSEEDTAGFYDGRNTQGTPTQYDKTANAIFLNDIPSYSISGGLKVYINREGSYFTTSDTTKKAGFAGIFHEYLALRASYPYASVNSLKNTNNILRDMEAMEKEIISYYGKRQRDVKPRMNPRVESNK